MSILKISVLNVGHGDFIYAITPLGNNLVIDCGSNDGGDVSPAQFLKNVHTIDELQISHPHTDHFGDIIEIGRKKINSFRCIPLEKFADGVIGWKNNDQDRINALRILKEIIAVDNNAICCNYNFEHSIFYPTNIDYTDPNTASCVTILSYAGFKILFGGDLPDSGWINLLKNADFREAIKGVNVFKVPHHGRKEGCSSKLFEYFKYNSPQSPQLCIISDKPIDETNKNTVATDWYAYHSTGAKVTNNGAVTTRKVVSTRNDGSIFIEVHDDGSWFVYLNTTWRR
jgi:beta-lactamase superfamily II metal-dependent hydrolase